MAITFDSPDDRFGIREGGSALAKALLQNNLLLREDEKLLKEQNRRDNLLSKQQGALANALFSVGKQDLTTLPGQSSFLQSLASQGGDVDQGLNYLKLIGSNKTAPSIAKNNIYQNDQEKSVSKYVTQVRNEGLKATQTLQELPQLKRAINSKELEDQGFLNRWITSNLNKAGLAGPVLNESEQVLATFGKSIVTDLSNLRGLRLTDAKLRWLEGAAPGVGKTVEANNVAFDLIEDIYQIKARLPQIVDQIIEENGGRPPINLQTIVAERVGGEISDYIDKRPEYDNGKEDTVEVPESKTTVFEKLPDVKEFSGKTVRNTDNGKRYRSNGSKWTEVK